ncbi:MAG TPA: RnfABCDGE type electron transport complex subunit D [Treponemataceae bacterium]|jgi:electron transport complex protein RnfD|nr:MAG: RnfABCDGE type electron transport complex subunit D [Treponema sp.]HOC28245.1 RnfABCDGE type electron transport complex subunit D [Treponemataceae bacterium]
MGASDKNEIYLSSSPHYAIPVSSKHIMFVVLASLLPAAVYGVYLFGFPALLTILVSVASAVGSEALFRFIIKEDIRVGDYSAAITGLLLAMILPPSTPVWMTALGAIFAVVVAKEFFGGLGSNVFNPALSGRAFLLVSFAGPLTTWTAPFSSGVDAVSAATPLSLLKPAEGAILTAAEIAEKSGFATAQEFYLNLFMGNRAGSIGESAIFLILLSFIFLTATKIIDWRTPVSMIVTTLAVTTIAGMDPLVSLLSGGLVFGAVFMATDYATSPVTPVGRLLFGFGCGLITALIRIFGGYPEGVMFSILIMNALVPFLNRIIPRKYGWVKPAKKTAAAPAKASASSGGAQ